MALASATNSLWCCPSPSPISGVPSIQPPTSAIPISLYLHPGTSPGLWVESGFGRMELEEPLFDLPTTSPAMKTQHTAQAAHSCLCACSLSGVRPGCGRGSLWQWWKGISTGLGSSGTGSEGSVKRLTQATWFTWPGLWADLFLTPRPWVHPTDCGPTSSFPRPSQIRDLGDKGPHERWDLNEQLRSQAPFSSHTHFTAGKHIRDSVV